MARGDTAFKSAFFWFVSHDAEFLDRYSRLIFPATYETAEVPWFLTQCLEYYEQYGRPITLKALEVKLAAMKDEDRFVKDKVIELFETEPPDEDSIDFLRDFAEGYLRRRQSEVIMTEYADALDKGDIDEIQAILDAGLKDLTATTGVEPAIVASKDTYLSTFEWIAAAYEDDSRAIPTGIPSLDSLLLGGARPSEMNVYLAPPNHGKSQWLTHVSREGWKRNKNVVYFSFEMGEVLVFQRFFSPLVQELVTKIPYAQPKKLAQRVGRYAKLHQLESQFAVKRFPARQANVRHIQDVLNYYEDSGLVCDLLVVDYADLVAPMRPAMDRRNDTTAAYEELRNLVVERDICFWTASQTNRLGLKSKVVKMEHLAEDFSKAMTADNIVAQSQTDKEKKVGEARLFLAKCRNNGQGEQILVDLDFPHATFSENTTGSTVGKEEDADILSNEAA